MMGFRGVATVTLLLGIAAGRVVADEPKDVQAALEEVLESETTPDLVRKIAASDPVADEVMAHLVADAPIAAEAAGPFLDATGHLVTRDGKMALAFANWLVRAVGEARQAKADEPELCKSLAQAWLVRARVGNALKQPDDHAAWTKAAGLFADYAEISEDPSEREDSALQAVALLHEGALADKALAEELLRRAEVISKEVLRVHGNSKSVRRAIADSCAATVHKIVSSSRNAASKALAAYFDAFGTLAKAEDAPSEDPAAFNEMVTFAADNKIRTKVGYITDEVMVANRFVTISIPRTRRFGQRNGQIRERKSESERYRQRVLAFQAYQWKSEYEIGDAGETAKGDDIKTLAKVKYDSLVASLDVKKKQKPSRKRPFKGLPAGTAFMVEGINKSGTHIRFSVFYVKAPKAKRTVRIILLELAKTGKDPEAQAMYDSIKFAK